MKKIIFTLTMIMAFAISGNAMENTEVVDYTMPEMTMVNQIEADNTYIYYPGAIIFTIVREYTFVDAAGNQWIVRTEITVLYVNYTMKIVGSFTSVIINLAGDHFNFNGSLVQNGGNVIGNTGEYDCVVMDQNGQQVPLSTIPAVELVKEFEQLAANAQPPSQ